VRRKALATSPARLRAAPGPEPYRIVLAEDDEPLRVLVASMLEDRGYEVRAFPNGLALLGYLRAATTHGPSPDPVLTDLQMPVMDGMELLRHVRELRQRVPVVLMSGRLDSTLRATALALGADLVLGKPFSMEELLSAVAQVAESAGRIRTP